MATASSPVDTEALPESAMPLAGMDAVILAGGLGTRLSAVLPDQQKVMADVAGQPFLGRLIDFYTTAGADRLVLALGHRAADVQRFTRSHTVAAELIASVEPAPLGTGGALRHALPTLHSTTVLVANGDSFAAVDLRALVNLHRRRQSAITLALTFVEDTTRYGRVEVDGEDKICAFTEKAVRPPCRPATPGYINAGIYLIERDVIAALQPNVVTSLERDVIPRWIGGPLHALAARIPFIDIGTPESWAAADAFFATLKFGGMRS